jgi:predicted outer membrane repeat protein
MGNIMIRSIIVLLLLAISLSAQYSEIWLETFGGESQETGVCTIETPEGDFLTCATKVDESALIAEIWLLATSSSGDSLWSRSYNTSTDYIEANSLLNYPTGGYLVSGNSWQDGAHFFIIRTTATGDTLWSRSFEGSFNSEAGSRSIIVTSDGGILATGRSVSNDTFVSKINSSGDLEWSGQYAPTNTGSSGAGSAIVELPDAGFLVAGEIHISNLNENSQDIWLVRLDSFGDSLWTKNINRGYDFCRGMIVDTNGGYTILAAASPLFGNGTTDTWLLKIDIDGNIINSNTFPIEGSPWNKANDLAQMADGTYLISGFINYSSFDPNVDAWLFGVDQEFELSWNYSIENDTYDEITSIRSTSSGGCIATGFSSSSQNNQQLLLLRISSIRSPQGLEYSRIGESQIEINWQTFPSNEAYKYYIYRDSISPAATLIDSVIGPSPETSFTDSGLITSTHYYYRIKEINTAGIESGFSTQLDVLLRDTLLVPEDFASIQSALNAASPTNIVMVSPGTYFENIFWPNTSGIQLLSEGGQNNTIIDGGGSGSALYMSHEFGVIDTTTRINGFTITNGSSVNGAGIILVSWDSPMLEFLTFTNNNASNNGGGLYIGEDCSPVLSQCLLESNTANQGGGLYLENSYDAVFENLLVRNNVAVAEGGGLWLAGNLSISNSIFQNNSAGAKGGAVRQAGDISYLMCEFSNNTADWGGGGALYAGVGGLHLFDSQLIGNFTQGSGGAIRFDNCHSTEIERVKISHNTSGQGGAIYGYSTPVNLSKVEITNNTGSTGGGINVRGSEVCSFDSVLIAHNSATGWGGGAYLEQPVNFNNCKIVSNNSDSQGGGIYSDYHPSSFSNTLIFSNHALGEGGAMYLNRHSPSISNSSIYNNESSSGVGGIYVNEATPTITNSNVAFNYYGIYNYTNTNTISATTNWWGNQSGPYHPNQNPAGTGDSTNQFVNVTPWEISPVPTGPLMPPQNLSIASVGNDFISIVWNQSPESTIVGYRIYADIDSTGYPYDNLIATIPDTTYTILNVMPGEVYYVSITSTDANGNESWYSHEVQATPQPAPIINVNPPSMTFMTSLVGEVRSMELTISNSGTDVLAVGDILHSTENIVVSSNTFEIPVGEDITVTIEVTPSQYGLSTDTLLIQNNSFNNPNLQVPVQWVGDLPESAIILSVNDVPEDQGGQVRITFAGSKYDGYDASQTIISYTVWRQLEAGAWDAIGMFNAVQDSIYHFVAPTLCDSTGEGICWSIFQVSAHTADAEIYYYSNPLAGYSVDNIAPSTPSGFMAQGGEGGIQLIWNSIQEEDFQYYAIYRSTQENFDPDTINTPHFTTIDTNFTDIDIVSPGTYYYRIAALDYAGNESGYSEQASATIVSIASGIELPRKYILDQNYPNPFNPTTTIKYGLPEDSNVSLVIYDVRGQVVQTLESGHQSAGWYDVVWNGQTADGHTISTGIYFARLVAGDYSQVVKMLYLK